MTGCAPGRGVSGFTYAEVLLATALVAMMLVPALEALSGGLAAAGVQRGVTDMGLRAASRMEEVMAMDFTSLDVAAQAAGSETTPSALSDTPGTVDRRRVYLSRYDGDDADADGNPFTGTDGNLLWVRVEIENAGHGLESLVSR